MSNQETGWTWFEHEQPQGSNSARPIDADVLARAFAHCFRGLDGELVMAHLESLTVGRSHGPDITDGQLRYAEGQRKLFHYIQSLVDRGRRGPAEPARQA